MGWGIAVAIAVLTVLAWRFGAKLAGVRRVVQATGLTLDDASVADLERQFTEHCRPLINGSLIEESRARASLLRAIDDIERDHGLINDLAPDQFPRLALKLKAQAVRDDSDHPAAMAGLVCLALWFETATRPDCRDLTNRIAEIIAEARGVEAPTADPAALAPLVALLRAELAALPHDLTLEVVPGLAAFALTAARASVVEESETLAWAAFSEVAPGHVAPLLRQAGYPPALSLYREAMERGAAWLEEPATSALVGDLGPALAAAMHDTRPLATGGLGAMLAEFHNAHTAVAS